MQRGLDNKEPTFRFQDTDNLAEEVRFISDLVDHIKRQGRIYVLGYA